MPAWWAWWTVAKEEKVGEVRRFVGHKDGVFGLALSPDGRYALSTSLDNSIRLWDLQSGIERRSYLGHSDHTHAVAFLRDGREFLSVSQDKTLRHWDLETGKELHRTVLGRESPNDVVVSSDGSLALVSVCDKTVRVWDIKIWKEIRRFEGHTGPVWRVAISADGRRALSAGETVRLWDMLYFPGLRSLTHGGANPRAWAGPGQRAAVSGVGQPAARPRCLIRWLA
jgi:WD40 repeat protein